MGDSEKDSADEKPVQPVVPLKQDDDELPDPDTQSLEEGIDLGDLEKRDE
jgi:hypothetical protein